mmetsp:Transcript_39620/g.60652  ORF Transcript_39620/g.60652 Transcript_39620/m.60652 type:complete len:148 (-) Transcript_39620:3625-4068(-)
MMKDIQDLKDGKKKDEKKTAMKELRDFRGKKGRMGTRSSMKNKIKCLKNFRNNPVMNYTMEDTNRSSARPYGNEKRGRSAPYGNINLPHHQPPQAPTYEAGDFKKRQIEVAEAELRKYVEDIGDGTKKTILSSNNNQEIDLAAVMAG